MLEQASWIATIAATVIAFVALFWVGKTILNKTQVSQNAKVSGRGNNVSQSSKVEVDK
ncbi:hypothetical protein [Agrobacterium leguminum]|uniref:hypothetical protein n=1 Tax=Agrobacterium leguminum TaxID=2792015 RepID=UPI003CE479EA